MPIAMVFHPARSCERRSLELDGGPFIRSPRPKTISHFHTAISCLACRADRQRVRRLGHYWRGDGGCISLAGCCPCWPFSTPPSGERGLVHGPSVSLGMRLASLKARKPSFPSRLAFSSSYVFILQRRLLHHALRMQVKTAAFG